MTLVGNERDEDEDCLIPFYTSGFEHRSLAHCRESTNLGRKKLINGFSVASKK